MKHLTVDEIVNFVTFSKIDSESLDNAAKVTAHISKCPDCLRKVRAFQMVYDEFDGMYKEKLNWKTVAKNMFNSDKTEIDDDDFLN